MSIPTKLIKSTFIVIVAFITYIAISIVYCANYRSAISSDVAVVLGAGIIHDKPSPVFRERINHGVSLYKAGKVKKIIFTGGIGKGEFFAESEVAKMYAIKHGVNSNDIFTEKKVNYHV